jgi:hypothetical protein
MAEASNRWTGKAIYDRVTYRRMCLTTFLAGVPTMIESETRQSVWNSFDLALSSSSSSSSSSFSSSSSLLLLLLVFFFFFFFFFFLFSFYFLVTRLKSRSSLAMC